MRAIEQKLSEMKKAGKTPQEQTKYYCAYADGLRRGQSMDEAMEYAELTTKSRKALDDSDFALPGRRYPIHDESHARNALARVAQHGSPAEKAKVHAAVHKKFPHIGKAS